MTHFSTANLIKQSALQLCYLRNNRNKIVVTDGQVKGNAIALSKSRSKYIEMRGTYCYDDMLFHYVFDEVIDSSRLEFIEHKSTMYGTPDWYINSSILQMALYSSLVHVNDNSNLVTASFVKGDKHSLSIANRYKVFKVVFDNNTEYTVNSINPEKIVAFYISKAIASMSYDTAREFDLKYKRKEFEILKQYFSY